VSFDVAADAYDDFMGRYSRLLAGPMADLADVRSGQRVLDVGCGPGALTAELVARGGSGCHVHHSFITRPDPGSLQSGLTGLRPRGGVIPARSQVRRDLDAPESGGSAGHA
jgi:SAM-dependent methyltransferase